MPRSNGRQKPTMASEPKFHGAANRRAGDNGEIIAFRDQDAPTPAPDADRTKGRITRNGTRQQAGNGRREH